MANECLKGLHNRFIVLPHTSIEGTASLHEVVRRDGMPFVQGTGNAGYQVTLVLSVDLVSIAHDYA